MEGKSENKKRIEVEIDPSDFKLEYFKQYFDRFQTIGAVENYLSGHEGLVWKEEFALWCKEKFKKAGIPIRVSSDIGDGIERGTLKRCDDKGNKMHFAWEEGC